MTAFPPPAAPRPALHSRPATAAPSSAPRNPAYAPKKAVTSVQPLRGFHAHVFSRPWGGPAGG